MAAPANLASRQCGEVGEVVGEDHGKVVHRVRASERRGAHNRWALHGSAIGQRGNDDGGAVRWPLAPVVGSWSSVGLG
jgi:hypothetical protein